MKPTPFLKKMDKDRFIQVPQFICNELNLSENDVFEIFINEDESSIIFKKIGNEEINYRK